LFFVASASLRLRFGLPLNLQRVIQGRVQRRRVVIFIFVVARGVPLTVPLPLFLLLVAAVPPPLLLFLRNPRFLLVLPVELRPQRAVRDWHGVFEVRRNLAVEVGDVVFYMGQRELTCASVRISFVPYLVSLTQSLNHSITQSLNHSITQSLNHSITQSLTHLGICLSISKPGPFPRDARINFVNRFVLLQN